MSFTVYVRRAAELDVAEAQNWYEEQQAGLAADFHYDATHPRTGRTRGPSGAKPAPERPGRPLTDRA